MPKRLALAAMLVAAAPAATLAGTPAAHDNIDALIEQHAKANKIPAAFVHKVVKRESNYNPRAKGGSALGLMQIKHATARGMGYSGDASGLYDPDTNLKYGIAYLAAAYRAAKGDVDQAYRYYNRGFYYAAKKLGIETTVPDESVSITARIANSATDFTKIFGLRAGEPAASAPPVQTASADPAAGIAGTPALAFAAATPATVAALAVPLPPRRPAALGGDAAAPAETVAATASSPPAQAATVTPAPSAQASGTASTDVVEVPLPPRRPAETVLVAAVKPAARKSRSAEPVIETAAAVPAQ